MHTARGFTLIELAIVMVIMAVTSAVAVPDLIDARTGKNQAEAGKTLTAIYAAQTTHHTKSGNYADSLHELFAAGLIGAELDTGAQGGYLFGVAATDNAFRASATPIVFGRAGTRSFYLDETGIVFGDPRCPVPQLYDYVLGKCTGPDAHLRFGGLDSLTEANALSAQAALPLAKALVQTPGITAMILSRMDANGDGTLTFDEVLTADLLAVGSDVRKQLGLNGGGAPIGKDAALRSLAGAYLKGLAADLALGVGGEGVPPGVAIAGMQGDPAALLGGVPAQ